jgi:phosphonoacetate hydrolase
MQRKTVLICLDGLDPDYLETARTPALDAVARTGFFKVGEGVLPSVTNVNNASILTGTFPETHGIASNYWYDPATGQGRFIETADYLRAPTALERAARAGLRTALLVTKEKLLHFLGRGAMIAFSAERPPAEAVQAVGAPASIYSAEIDYWQLRALRWVLRTFDPDLIYCSTTDYVMHKHGPESAEAIRHVETLDALLGELLEAFPEHQMLITADHGMRDKTIGLDLVALLGERSIPAAFVPPIKDRYVVHHDNMGGAGYLYLAPERVAEALALLRETDGIEAVYLREEAVERFRLPADRIGDLFVLATPETVFVEPGSTGSTRAAVRLRSHGGAYEIRVPIWGYRAEASPEQFRWNLDIVRLLDLPDAEEPRTATLM